MARHHTSHTPAPGVFRTPEERFEGLPDFAFEPAYRTVGELRLAHLDVGEGAPVVMLHGEPDLVIHLAQGDPAGSRRWVPLRGARSRGIRTLR